MPLPRQALLGPNKTGKNDLYSFLYYSCLSDPLCNCILNFAHQTAHCRTAEQTLDSFLKVFSNFKASFCKPVDFSNICNNNNCENSLNCNLKLFYQNVRGLKTKLVSLSCSFPMFYFYDIIILTETWLSPDISASEFGFTGFQIIRLDRNHNNSTSLRGGGVLIAIKNTFPFQPVPLTVSNVEQVFVLLSLNP